MPEKTQVSNEINKVDEMPNLCTVAIVSVGLQLCFWNTVQWGCILVELTPHLSCERMCHVFIPTRTRICCWWQAQLHKHTSQTLHNIANCRKTPVMYHYYVLKHSCLLMLKALGSSARKVWRVIEKGLWMFIEKLMDLLCDLCAVLYIGTSKPNLREWKASI